MRPVKTLFQEIPFYPLLLGLYPVLYLYAANYDQVQASAILRSLLISAGITALVCLVCLAIFRRRHKAALLAGLSLVLFFTYGHFHNLANRLEILGIALGRHRITLALWGFLFLLGAIWIVLTRSNLRSLSRALNLVSSLLVLLALAQLGYFSLNGRLLEARAQANTPQPQALASLQPLSPNAPDVYYFVLDGYSRQDYMEQNAQLDNQAFIDGLEQLGFVVPDCTHSNYNTTTLAVDSTLNMTYVDQLGFSYPDLAKEEKSFYLAPIKTQIAHNQVMDQFKEMGYRIITLKNDFLFIDFPKSDEVINRKTSIQVIDRGEALKFQNLFLNTTLLRVPLEESVASPRTFKKLPPLVLQLINPDLIPNRKGYVDQLYDQTLYQLGQLETIARAPGRKFVYAHLMVTHPPYLFDLQGNLREKTTESDAAYRDQVIYANKRILTIVKNILAQSKTPPVIILQGDHARGWEGVGDDGFKILNAYYLPQNANSLIYSTITPVNTFRLVLSTFFGKEYPLLPDQSIRLDAGVPGGYEVVPATCVH